MEEGTLAAWALEVCVRFGEKLVITNPKENHWIGSSGQKNDRLDALKLAQLLCFSPKAVQSFFFSD
ncbi:hypothetical protein ACFLVW_08010 [Chloroflexota bacterium]